MKFNFGKGWSPEKTPLGPVCWFWNSFGKDSSSFGKDCSNFGKGCSSFGKGCINFFGQVQRNLLHVDFAVVEKSASCVVCFHWLLSVFLLIFFLIFSDFLFELRCWNIIFSIRFLSLENQFERIDLPTPKIKCFDSNQKAMLRVLPSATVFAVEYMMGSWPNVEFGLKIVDMCEPQVHTVGQEKILGEAGVTPA